MECKSVRETGYDVLVRVIFIAHTHTIAMNKYRFKLEAKAKKKKFSLIPFRWALVKYVSIVVLAR